MQLKVSATAFRSLFLSFSILLSCCPAFAEGNNAGQTKEAASVSAGASPEAKVDEKVAAAIDTKIDAKVDQLLKKMSDFYAGLKSFKTVLQYQMSVRQGAEKDERKTAFKIFVQRPNKLAITIDGSDRDRYNGSEVRMDGDNRYLYNPRAGYIKDKATSTFFESFRDREFFYATGFNFGGLNALECLLAEDPYQFMQKVYGITGGSLIGKETIDGVECEHIKVEAPKMAWDMWIESGKTPWLRRISPALGKMMGDQNISIVFDYTQLADTKIAASEFKFTPPTAAKEIKTFFGEKKKAEESGHAAAAEAEEHPLLKKEAPAIELSTLDGGKFNLADLKGKNVVVLDFWATWCPPCRQALPILAEVTKAYESKGVKFFAIDLREEPGKIEAFLRSQGLSINVALDKDGKVANAYKVEGIPQSVIIGKDGIVKVVHVGFGGDLKSRLAAELDSILNEK
ncbi:redoxin domain-containing protein [bacterium]|jgi:peroxiredoxin|nr:redoxin domain-containing protein [bacterium]